MYRRMWQRAIDEALAQLSSTSQDGLLFIGKRRGNWVDTQMEHLTCFLPGNLALGALHGAVATAAFPAYMQAAAAMTETCWQMYERTATGDPSTDSLAAENHFARRHHACCECAAVCMGCSMGDQSKSPQSLPSVYSQHLAGTNAERCQPANKSLKTVSRNLQEPPKTETD